MQAGWTPKARRLAEEGASVVIADIRGHEAAATSLRAEGLDVDAMTADVSSDDSVACPVTKLASKRAEGPGLSCS